MITLSALILYFPTHIPLRIVADDGKGTPTQIPLCGVVVTPKLQLMDASNSCSLDRVAFGDVYYDTVVSRRVLLFNNSPVSTQYLAVINSNAEGSVDGMNVNEGLAMVCSNGGQYLKACKPQDNALPGETLVEVIPMQVHVCQQLYNLAIFHCMLIHAVGLS